VEFHHISVLLNECIEGLNISPDKTYVDGTLGGAGHASKVCEKLNENGLFIGIDQDINAINKANQVLSGYKNKKIFQHENFSSIKSILQSIHIEKVDGILLDLGVSSHQLDEADRGFSYMQDAKLDMRMDVRAGFSAYNVVNDYTQKELEKVIWDYGEERWAKRIVEFIVAARQDKPIETTYELVDIIKRAIPKSARKDGPHPAKRTFQAIRIEVNGELSILKKAIEDMVDVLAPNGRVCIITFHSLEDRIVKEVFRSMENPCTCPPKFPVCICGAKPKGKVITRKPILPSAQELEENHRSRSAKLRIFEKIG
jgi:16S rRNA (cytosine1402-N4)-methyltransferase